MLREISWETMKIDIDTMMYLVYIISSTVYTGNLYIYIYIPKHMCHQKRKKCVFPIAPPKTNSWIPKIDGL